MATTIPAANVKVFPSAADINSGDTGAGNIVTETNVAALLQSMPPRNFVISGFTLAYASPTTVTITAGEAFVAGRYVKTDAAVTYTLDPVPPAAVRQVYFFLTIVPATPTNPLTDSVSVQFENSNQDNLANPPSPNGANNLSVMLGVAPTDSGGEMESGVVYQSKVSLGGGVYSGTYVGTGPGAEDYESLTVSLPFTPSFVYVAGEAGAGGTKIVACSGVLPAGPRTVNVDGLQSIDTMYSCGWCMVEDAITTHPKTYSVSTEPWTGGLIPKGLTELSDPITLTGVRPGDSISIGGSNFCRWGQAGAISEDDEGAGTNQIGYIAAGVYGGGYKGLSPTAPRSGAGLHVSAFVDGADKVRMALKNLYAGIISSWSMTPNPTNTGTITVQSAWQMQTYTKVFLESTDPTSAVTATIKPLPTSGGFRVSRSTDGVGGSGQTLNTENERYFYWAFGA